MQWSAVTQSTAVILSAAIAALRKQETCGVSKETAKINRISLQNSKRSRLGGRELNSTSVDFRKFE